MILVTDVDETHCPQQLFDVPVLQIDEKIVEVITAFHGSEFQNEWSHRSSTRQNRHTQSGGEDQKKFSISRSKLRTHRMQRLSQGATHQ